MDDISELKLKISSLQYANSYLNKLNTKICEENNYLKTSFPDNDELRNLKIITIKDDPIISKEEQSFIIEWTKSIKHELENNGYERWKQPFRNISNVPEIIYDIKERIENREREENFDLSTMGEEPTLLNSVGYAKHGSQLHRHTDPNQDGFIHVRYNVYVQIPISGGIPVYDNKIIDIKERNYVCCISGVDEHFSIKSLGNRERIVLSYGYLVPVSKYKRLKNKTCY